MAQESTGVHLSIEDLMNQINCTCLLLVNTMKNSESKKYLKDTKIDRYLLSYFLTQSTGIDVNPIAFQIEGKEGDGTFFLHDY